MEKIKISHSICLIIIMLLINGCIEPFNYESKGFQSALVVEATITNELKYQEVSLSKTYRLDNDGLYPESEANIKIIDDIKNIYSFHEISPGHYISNNEFKAEKNKNYQLFITTSEGTEYFTNPIQLTSTTQIDNLSAAREIDDLGNDNMVIYVNSYDPSGSSRYYRYEYEETFKIIAPKWNAYDLIIPLIVFPYRIEKVFKTKEEHICYKSLKSLKIIQTETNGLTEDRVSKFPVRVLSKDNTLISHRYSILVKQYIQSMEAYTYYKTLSKISSSESLFSQNQPGYFSGNILSVNNPKEKVIGYFEMSSVSYQRIFFNYKDYFPKEPLPPYFIDCTPYAPSIVNQANDPSPLAESIISGKLKYYRPNSEPNYSNPGPYLMVPAECGDCTKYGTNIKPDFWID